MISKRYSEYETSNIGWIKQLPSSWDELPLRAIFEERSEKNKNGKETLILSLVKDIGVIKYDEKGNIGNKAKQDLSGYCIAYPNDLVLNKMNAVIGSLGISKYKGLVSPIYLVLFLKNKFPTDINFIGFVFKNKVFQKSFRRYAKGIMEIRESIDYNEFKKVLIPIPPLTTQTKIAEYLDRKQKQANNFITKQQKMIELLKEQKKAIINQAVTKGLNPNVKMKDSGVEWLGEIPEHWEVRKLKFISDNLNNRRIPLETTIRGKMKNKLYDYYGATGVIDKVNDYIFDDELILIAEDGANLVLRNIKLIYVAKGKFWVNNHAHILKPKKDISIKYLECAMESFDYNPLIKGAAQPKLTKESLMNIELPSPNSAEQIHIMKYIESNTEKIDLAISKAEEEIKLVKEYLESLIFNVVTGQICVE